MLTLYGYTQVFGIPIFPVGRVSACTKCCFQAGVMTISTLNFDRYSFLSQMNWSQCLAWCHCKMLTILSGIITGFVWFILLASATGIDWNFLLLPFLSGYPSQKSKDSSRQLMWLLLIALEFGTWLLSQQQILSAMLQLLTDFAQKQTNKQKPLFWFTNQKRFMNLYHESASIATLTKIKPQFYPIFRLTDSTWSLKHCPNVLVLSPTSLHYRRDEEDSIKLNNVNYFCRYGPKNISQWLKHQV